MSETKVDEQKLQEPAAVTNKGKKKAVSVTWTANVKYGEERYNAGDKTEINSEDLDELVKAGVIEEE